MTTLWSVDAHDRSPRDAALEFARTYWPDGPRKVLGWTVGGRFRTSGGVAWYRVVLRPTIPPTYAVSRET